MKTISIRILIIFLFLSAVLTVGAAPDRHHLVKTSFNGTETFGGMINPGTQSMKDSKVVIKGMVEWATDNVSDPRVCGKNTVVINTIFDPVTYIGPMWGTGTLKNAAGQWNFLWVGKLTGGGQAVIYEWGWGEGGYRGMTAYWEYNRQSPYTPTSNYDVSGYILEYK